MKKLLAILMILALACGCAFAEEGEPEEDAITSVTLKSITKLPEVETQDNGILVIYFSPDDTTRAAAYVIAAELNAGLFELVPEELYTEEDLDYTNSFSRCSREMRDKDVRPAITALPEDLSKYDTILLGYPIWGGQAPKIMLSFVESADLSGKTVVPFCTSNSSGFGSSDKDLKKAAGDSVTWKKGGRVKKGATAEEIARWVQEELLAPQE